jgi:hypothetical protein
MPSVSNKVSKKTMTFTVPETVYDLAVASAQSGGQSLAGWARNAIAGAARKWKAPAGNVEGAGYFCGQCQRPANKCSRPEQHKSSEMWGKVE